MNDRPTHSLLVPLDAALSLNPRQVGGKAHNLATLVALGVSVPTGCVLTCEAFARHLALDGRGDAVETLRRGLDTADPAERREVSRDIQTRVTAGPLPLRAKRSVRSRPRPDVAPGLVPDVLIRTGPVRWVQGVADPRLIKH